MAAAAVICCCGSARRARPTAPRPRRARVPTSWTSRPADPLIGPIAREHAGDASTRIDTIFADRLDGYRERELAAEGEAMKHVLMPGSSR